MPYRRLPNTDKSRIRAMETALNENRRTNNGNSVISHSTVYNLELKIEDFKASLSNYKQCLEEQKEFNKIYLENFHKTRLYISHFIQIINFAIARGEYPRKIRKYYEIPVNSNTLPSLQNFEEISKWANIIISGEQLRIANGGKPFQMPSVASINMLFDRLKDENVLLQNLKRKTFNAKIKLSAIRPQIDDLIKDIWDQIENYFENYPSLILREKAKTFGIVYFYRKNEEKIELKDLLKL